MSPANVAPKEKCTTIQSGTLLDTKENAIELGYDKWGYNYQAHMFNGWFDNNTRPDDLATSGDTLMMKWNDAWLSNKDCDGDDKLDRHYENLGYKDSGAWLTNHASGTYDLGNVTGVYTFYIHYSGQDYYYNVDLTQSGNNVSGTLTENYLPSPPQYLDLTGTVTGNSFELKVTYPGNPWDVRTFTGSIDESGNLSGSSWSDNGSGNAFGTWSTTSGEAVIDACTWKDFVKIVAVPSTAHFESGYFYTDNSKMTEIGPAIWGDFAIIQEVSSDPCGQGVDLDNYKSELRSGLGNW